MSQSDIEAGKAYVTLYAKDSLLIKSLAKVQVSIASVQRVVLRLADTMAVLGLSLTAGLTAAISRFENVGSALADMEARTGVAAGSLAQMSYAAEQAGAELSDIETAIRKMQVGIVNGSKAFGEMGLSLDKLNKMSPEQKFEAVLEAIAKIKSPTQRAATAVEVFGKSGTKLLPMLAGGIEGFRDLRKEAERLGAPTTKEARLADELGDALGRMREIATNAAFSMGAALAPSLIRVMEVAQGAAEGAQKWVRENHAVVQMVGKLGTGLLLGALAMRGLSYGLSAASVGMGFLQSVTMPAAFAIGVLRNRIGQLASISLQALGNVRKLGEGIRNALAGIGNNAATVTGGLGRIALGFAQIGASAGMQLATAVGRSIAAAAPSVWQATRAVGAGAVTALKFHAQQAAEAFAPLGRMIAAKMGPGVRKAFLEIYFAASLALEKTKFLWQPIVAAGRAAITSIASFWRSNGKGIANTLVSTLTGAFNRVRAVGIGTMRAIRAGAGNIRGGLGGVASGVGGILGMAGGMIGGGAGAAVGSLGSVLTMATMVVGLVNPVTITVAAIGAGVYAWTRFSDSGKRALKVVTDALRPFYEIARDTIKGISDAFTAGDIELAGKIAFAGLKVAALTALAAIGKAIGGVFGESIGTLGAQLAGGDFAGAWKTVLVSMSGMWDAWSEGVVKTWTAAMRAVVDAWKSTVTGMGNWILQQSAEGGVMGSVINKVLGIDMKAADAQKELHNKEQIKRAQERIEQNKRMIEDAKQNGGVAPDGFTTIADMEANIRDAEKSIALAGGAATATAEAQADVARLTGSTAAAMKTYLDDMDNAAQAASDQAAEQMAENNKGQGLTAAEQAAADAAAELAALRNKAAAAAAEVKARAEIGAEDINAPDVADLRKQSFGSFSAAGLMAVGQGGVQQRMLEELKKQRELQQEQLKATERLRDAVKNNQLQVIV